MGGAIAQEIAIAAPDRMRMTLAVTFRDRRLRRRLAEVWGARVRRSAASSTSTS